ncbi:MAG: TetR family transcriptional regulator [Actinophytocola sp.]|nr:TetR family transcriptional regulator [Actinophytocola sp.]
MTEPERRTRRGRPPLGDRRQEIIQAAQEILADRGYAHTSMKQIADRAGIAPGLLTYYFPAKQALLLEVVAELEKEFTYNWRAELSVYNGPLERIGEAFDKSIAKWSAQPELFRIFYDLSTLASVDEEIKQRLQVMLRRIRAVADEEMRRIAADLPTPPPPNADLASAITAGFHGALYEALTLGEDPRPALTALRFMALSSAAMSYVAAGQRPPIDLDEL